MHGRFSIKKQLETNNDIKKDFGYKVWGFNYLVEENFLRKQIPELVHPHDNFFKVMWGNPSEAEVFIEYYLPKTIVEIELISSFDNL